jgi:hypothetical protein
MIVLVKGNSSFVQLPEQLKPGQSVNESGSFMCKNGPRKGYRKRKALDSPGAKYCGGAIQRLEERKPDLGGVILHMQRAYVACLAATAAMAISLMSSVPAFADTINPASLHIVCTRSATRSSGATTLATSSTSTPTFTVIKEGGTESGTLFPGVMVPEGTANSPLSESLIVSHVALPELSMVVEAVPEPSMVVELGTLLLSLGLLTIAGVLCPHIAMRQSL